MWIIVITILSLVAFILILRSEIKEADKHCGNEHLPDIDEAIRVMNLRKKLKEIEKERS